MAKSQPEVIGSYASDPNIGVPTPSGATNSNSIFENSTSAGTGSNLVIDPYAPSYYPSVGGSSFLFGTNTTNMSNKMNIYKKLNDVMAEMGYVEKDGKVSVGGGGYQYPTESAFIATVRPLFIKYGLVIYPTETLFHTTESYDKNAGKVYLTTITVKYHIGDVDTGEYIEVEVAAQGSDSGDKGVYKALTGAYKYAMRQALMIGTGDDPEATDEDGRDTSRNYRAERQPRKTQVEEEPEEQQEESATDKYYNMVVRGLNDADEETLAALKKYRINPNKPPTETSKVKALYTFLREVRAGKDVTEAAKSLDGKL